jgi:hypothetical protein
VEHPIDPALLAPPALQPPTLSKFIHELKAWQLLVEYAPPVFAFATVTTGSTIVSSGIGIIVADCHS